MMKRKMILSALLLCLSMAGWAEKGVLVLPAPQFDGCYTQVANASRNGEWATGAVWDGTNYQAFRWNTRHNVFEYLNGYGPFSFGFAISNDGVVVGEYDTTELMENGAEIKSPCVWFDGKWHVLDIGTMGNVDPELAEMGGARNITPDGRFVVGALSTRQGWKPCVWELDANHKSRATILPSEETGVLEHVSDDGSVIGGFDHHQSIRIPAYWTAEAGGYTEVIPDGRSHMGLLTITHGVSPNGRYVATWNKLFDRTAGTSEQFDADMPLSEVTIAGVTDGGKLYGSGVFASSVGGRASAAYRKGSEWVELQKMLTSLGASFEKGCRLTDIRYMNDEETIFCVNAVFFDGTTRGIMIRLDEEITNRPPVALKVNQMTGLTATKVSWAEPLANAKGVTAYEVYRNGKRIYSGTDKKFTDRDCAFGVPYTYTVKAVYAGNVTSEDSDPVTITLQPNSVAAPANLVARQTGLNKVRLAWDAAGTNLPSLQYFEEDREVVGFGGGAWDMETAVRFRNSDLQLYKGMEISEVTFYPMTAQNSWTLNFYTGSGINGKPFYTETLDAAQLQYGTKNTIRLKTPVQVPADEDIVVGVCVDVDKSSYNVLGVVVADNEPGYNDLIRQPGRKFVSLYEDGLTAGYEYTYSWPIILGMAPTGGNMATLSHYQIYQDGKAVATAPANSHKFVFPEVGDGTHQYAVSAVYSDAQESGKTQAEVEVAYNDEYYLVTDMSVKIDEKMNATVTWREPKDDEKTYLGFCQKTFSHGVGTSAENGYSFQAASVYSHNMLSQYIGDYQISGIRFYPVGNAEFSIFLNGGDDNLWSCELERRVDYTLGEWNTMWLDEPILLDGKYNDYELIIDCYDGDADAAILGMDNMPANLQYSDLYSLDDGQTWASYENETGMRGNWMMELVLTAVDQKALPVQGYTVEWDGKNYGGTIKPGSELTESHQFSLSDSENQLLNGNGSPFASKHRVSVSAIYGNTADDIWSSTPYYFSWMLTPTAITAPTASPEALSGNIYDLTGRRVTNPKRGIYIINGKKIQVK